MLENCQINNYEIIKQLGSEQCSFAFHVKDIISKKDFTIKIIIKSSFQSHYYPDNHNNKEQGCYTRTQINRTKDDILYYFRLNQYKVSLPLINLNSIKNLLDEELSTFKNYKEISLHLKVHSHKNIATIHELMETPLVIFVLLDYYQTDLFNSIVISKRFINNGWLIKKVFLQICSALQYCHSKKIYHCDIKPENIFLDKNDNIYLGNFGLATKSKWIIPHAPTSSSFYMAPERVLYFKYSYNSNNYQDFSKFCTYKTDIWSLGILLINLICIRHPWSRTHQLQDVTFRYFVMDSTVLKSILPVSNELYHILVKVLQLNPSLRCNIATLMTMIKNCTSFLCPNSIIENIASALNIVPILSEDEYNNFIAINEVYEDIFDINYIYSPYHVNRLGVASYDYINDSVLWNNKIHTSNYLTYRTLMPSKEIYKKINTIFNEKFEYITDNPQISQLNVHTFNPLL